MIIYKMLEFYRKAVLIFLALMILTVFFAYICVERVFISDPLLPAHESRIPWKFETLTDVLRGGSSSMSVTDATRSLDFEYYLTDDIMYPYVTAIIAFDELEGAKHLVDLSRYSTATFEAKCVPHNVLNFFVYSFDEDITDPGTFYSYRVASASFSCNEEQSMVKIDLKHLQVPSWWLEMSNADISDQSYRLDKVVAIGFDAARQGPLKTLSRVNVSQLVLHGHDWRYAWFFAGLSLIIWGGFSSWFFRQYTLSLVADVKDRLKKDRPLLAYQQLSIEPYRDKEKSHILRFMATEFANPEMRLEFAMAALGINRIKINEILRNELGMTFNVYLNKLRLSEAARLLSEDDTTSVAEVAHSVGYNNVSYFNKLFKNEYGYTPKTFRFVCKSTGVGEARVTDTDKAGD